MNGQIRRVAALQLPAVPLQLRCANRFRKSSCFLRLHCASSMVLKMSAIGSTPTS